VTRNELTRKVHEVHGGLTLASAHEVVSTVLQSLHDGLVEDGRVVLSGFGTFKVVTRKERVGRDIRRGVSVSIPPCRDVVFIPSRKEKGTD